MRTETKVDIYHHNLLLHRVIFDIIVGSPTTGRANIDQTCYEAHYDELGDFWYTTRSLGYKQRNYTFNDWRRRARLKK